MWQKPLGGFLHISKKRKLGEVDLQVESSATASPTSHHTSLFILITQEFAVTATRRHQPDTEQTLCERCLYSAATVAVKPPGVAAKLVNTHKVQKNTLRTLPDVRTGPCSSDTSRSSRQKTIHPPPLALQGSFPFCFF